MNFSPDGSENPVYCEFLKKICNKQIVTNSRINVDKNCKVLLQKKGNRFALFQFLVIFTK
jgi:hypothetical protein